VVYVLQFEFRHDSLPRDSLLLRAFLRTRSPLAKAKAAGQRFDLLLPGPPGAGAHHFPGSAFLGVRGAFGDLRRVFGGGRFREEDEMVVETETGTRGEVTWIMSS
jgi:hypothetical protein